MKETTFFLFYKKASLKSTTTLEFSFARSRFLFILSYTAVGCHVAQTCDGISKLRDRVITVGNCQGKYKLQGTSQESGHAGPLLSLAPPLELMNPLFFSHQSYFAHSVLSPHSSTHFPCCSVRLDNAGIVNGSVNIPSNFATRIHFTAVRFCPLITGHAPCKLSMSSL